MKKVFCIGFHKTGTTSLEVALGALGYRVTGPNGHLDPDIEKNVLTMAYELVEQYDAFQDNPWPILYRQLDAKYPGSKFILTLRDSESWIESQVKFFGRRETPMRRLIYGVGNPEGNEAVYLERFESHNREVLEHFTGRPDDLLVMDFSNGDGWEKLCPFLGQAVPITPFPHANRAKEKKTTFATPLIRRTKRLAFHLAGRGSRLPTTDKPGRYKNQVSSKCALGRSRRTGSARE